MTSTSSRVLSLAFASLAVFAARTVSAAEPAAPGPSDPQPAATAPARDQAEPAPEAEQTTRRLAPIEASLDSAIYGSGGVRGMTSLSHVLSGTYRAKRFELEGQVPFATSFGGGSNLTAIGNPTVGGYYAHDFPMLRLRVGAAVALPISGDNLGDASVNAGAMQVRGMENAWLWQPKRLSVLPQIKITSRNPQGLQYGADLTAGTTIGLGGATQADLIIQAGAEGAYQVGIFRAGARLALASAPMMGSMGTNAQLSVTPFVGLDGHDAFVTAGLLMNLNEPLGFSFADNRVWGAKLSAGVRF